MAKKFSSKDLFESEDIFKGIRDSAEKTLVSLNKINDEFKQTAATLKQSLGDAKFDSSDSIKKFTAATAEANKIQKQAIEIEKLQEQVRQQAIKTEKEQERLAQERIKTQKAESQEQERLSKQSEKQVKAAQNEASAYKQLEKATRELKNQSKELGAQLIALEKSGEQNTTAYIELEKQFVEVTNAAREQDKILKDVDKSVGDNFRNVGNYEGATKNLKTELRALTRELMNMSESDPKFQEMAQRAGELKDQISDTQDIVKATAGSAVENLGGAMASVGQVGIAAFQGIESSMVLMGIENENILASMQKLQALAGLSDALGTLGAVGDKLNAASAGFQAFGSKAIGAFKGMTTAGKAFAVTGIGLVIAAVGYAAANWDKLKGSVNAQTSAQKVNNEVTRTATASIANELSAADKLGKQLKSETLTRQEKIQKVKEFQAAYPGLLSNMNAETNSIDQINTQLTKNITLLRLQAQAKAIEAVRADKLQEKINLQLDRQAESQENATNWTLNFGESAKNGWIGFSTASENAAEAGKNLNQITTTGTQSIDKQINSLDQQSEELDKAIAAQKKNGAVVKDNSGAIVDYSKNVAGFTGVNDKYNQSLERQKKILEDLNALKKEVFEAEMEYLKSLETEQKQEEIAVGEKYDNLILRAKANEIDITLLEEAKGKALLDIQKKYSDLEIEKKKEKDAQIIELEKQTQDKLNAEYEKGLDDRFQAELLMADDIKKERLNSEKEYQNDLDKLNELNINGSIKSQKEYDTALAQIESRRKKRTDDIDKKAGADEVKKQEERQKTIEQFANKTAEYFKKKSEEKIKAIDAEIAAAQKQSDTLKALAESGNINAQQSLAKNQEIINKANLKKEKELRKQKKMEAGLAIFKLFSANADKKNPLAATIADTTGLLAFISTLPMFHDGTENTGSNGQGIDGKGGFHAVLHPNERVVPKSLNDQIGSMSNEQLTKIAQEYQNGRLITKSNANSSLDLVILANKLDTLTDVIKNKPETNIALGEITQSAMNIVESKRTGNTTVYNRFKVRK
jgi:hypothetical protein